MNKNNNNADFCGRVPLNQTNLIQPHGVLVVVNKADLNIIQVSENAPVIFNVAAPDLVNTNFSDHVSSVNSETLKSVFAEAHIADKLPLKLHIGADDYLSIIHQQQEFFIIEIEIAKRTDSEEQSFVSVFQEVKYVMASIEAANTVIETCDVVANELKKLSAFDKVMVYCFDREWNGDVIAEAKEDYMDSYLGLKFPASDIPKQARDLYKKTAYRLIPTIDYEPVRLYPVLNPVTNAFTNLSDSSLRSVAAVHLEYLHNMNVAASMSTRILKDGELWGLIACHHKTPFYLSYEMCSMFELLSNFITTKIASVENRDRLEYTASKQKEQTAFMQRLYENAEPVSYKNNISSLLEADGVAIVLDNHIEATGNTPSRQEVEDLIVWLQSNDVADVYQQQSLAAVYEPAEAYADSASGLLAIPIEPSKGAYILAFRAEAVRKVDWGGDPSEALQFESDGKKYHPRASFKIWQQTVRQSSLPWKSEVLQTAEALRNLLTSFRLNKN